MPNRPWTPKSFLCNSLVQSCKKRSFLRLFAGFFMEESCRGFFVSNWLCSKPGRSLCERIKLTFATAPGCLHSLSLGRHDRFCGCLPVSVLECFLVIGTRRVVSGFGSRLLISRGFFDAKAFFAVVREGVADKPG